MTLRATLYDAKGHDREVELDDAAVRKRGRDQMLWVDVDGIDADALARIASALQLPDEVARGIVRRDAGAELQRFSEVLRLRVMAAQPVAKGNGRGPIETAAIDIVAAPNLVVTVHEGSIAAFESFVETLHGETRLGVLDAASFMAALVDSVLAVYLDVVEQIERRVDALDELALRSGDEAFFLGEVVTLRRRVASVRRNLAPLRVALAPLARPDLEIPELGKPWPGLLDRLERAIDAAENARELLIGSFDVYMARSAGRTNDIMKTLTILNAVLLPAVVVAGVMGMNFGLEFFENTGNFWLVLGAMATLAVGILGVSRRRGWI